MYDNQNGCAVIGCSLVILVFLAGIVGYIMNIAALFCAGDLVITTKIVMRIIGIFVPFIGAVLGYL